ncbi:hypothetical protein CGRA01v4_01816 [Colletotrichum graminicola]|nr:hypothetical protein CGRA01v4_01816 [Colletotrichum graminicola]
MKPMRICSWEITHTPPLIVAFCTFCILDFPPSPLVPRLRPHPIYPSIHPALTAALIFPPSPIRRHEQDRFILFQGNNHPINH